MRQRILSALDWLQCERGPALVPYYQHKDFCTRRRVIYLTTLFDVHWYLPKSVNNEHFQTIYDRFGLGEDHVPQIKMQLYTLWLGTKHEKKAEADRDAMLALYATRLARFPLPVVAAAVNRMLETATFFPSLAEMEKEMRVYGNDRLIFLACLRDAQTRLGLDAQ